MGVNPRRPSVLARSEILGILIFVLGGGLLSGLPFSLDKGFILPAFALFLFVPLTSSLQSVSPLLNLVALCLSSGFQSWLCLFSVAWQAEGRWKTNGAVRARVGRREEYLVVTVTRLLLLLVLTRIVVLAAGVVESGTFGPGCNLRTPLWSVVAASFLLSPFIAQWAEMFSWDTGWDQGAL